MAKLVSKTYGDALYELGVEQNNLDELYREVMLVVRVLNENPKFSKIMNHPKIVKEEKEAVMEEAFKGRVCDELTGFLKLIISKNRYADIDAILNYFILRYKEYKKIGIAYVSTPLPLNEIQKSEIMDCLIRTTSYEQMEMSYEIDPSLIGGMVIRIGDKVVDSSVKSKLNALSKELMKIQLSSAE